jgi:hypothetical protein
MNTAEVASFEERVELWCNGFIERKSQVIERDPFEAHLALLAESSTRRAKYMMTGATNEELLISALALERVAQKIEEEYF